MREKVVERMPWIISWRFCGEKWQMSTKRQEFKFSFSEFWWRYLSESWVPYLSYIFRGKFHSFQNFSHSRSIFWSTFCKRSPQIRNNYKAKKSGCCLTRSKSHRFARFLTYRWQHHRLWTKKLTLVLIYSRKFWRRFRKLENGFCNLNFICSINLVSNGQSRDQMSQKLFCHIITEANQWPESICHSWSCAKLLLRPCHFIRSFIHFIDGQMNNFHDDDDESRWKLKSFYKDYYDFRNLNQYFPISSD